MLTECARMLWRRRLWVAVALLLAGAAGVGAYGVIKPGQESKAQVLFLGSIKQPGISGATNPYLNFGGSLAITASAVQQGVTSDQVAQRLNAAGNRATYKVEPNLAENAGPVLLVTVDDPSPAMVEQTLKAVLLEISARLKALQVAKNVPQDLFITAQTLTESPHPVAVHKAQTQKAVLAFLAVVVILVAAILVLERRQVSRSSNHAGDPQPGPPIVIDEIRPSRPAAAQSAPLPATRARLRSQVAPPRTIPNERGRDGARRSTRRPSGNPPTDTSRL